MAQDKPERLTLGEALKDFGFFSMLFAVTVSGPSVLSLLQAVFVEHRLVDALQWIVDGYNRIVGVLGAMVEPLVQPAIDWVNAEFSWELELYPHWRPVFVLLMIVAGGICRGYLTTGHERAWASIAALTIPATLGALAAGFIPPSYDGFIVLPPAFSMLIGLAIADGLDENSERLGLLDAPSFWIFAIILSPLWGTLILSDHIDGSAFLMLGFTMMCFGLMILFTGLKHGYRSSVRIALTILGGFFAAGIALGANAILRSI